MSNEKYTGDTIEDREFVAEKLSSALGFPVKIDKIANLLTIVQEKSVGVVIGEVVEQELMVAEDPLQLLVDRTLLEVPVPPAVFVPKEAMQRPGPLASHLPDGAELPHATIPTELGPAELYTFSSARHKDLRLAKNELASYMEGMRYGRGVVGRDRPPMVAGKRAPSPQNTIVVVGEIRTYEDPITKDAQAWFDGTVLWGDWVWDRKERRLVKAKRA